MKKIKLKMIEKHPCECEHSNPAESKAIESNVRKSPSKQPKQTNDNRDRKQQNRTLKTSTKIR